MSEISISQTGNKQKNVLLCLHMFFSCTIPQWNVFHKCDITDLLISLSMRKRHLEHCNVKCVEQISGKNGE